MGDSPIEVSTPNLEEGWMGVDIGPKTVDRFIHEIQGAKTVFTNGPMGIFEVNAYSVGTKKILEAIAGIDGLSVVGGGDSASAAKHLNVSRKFSHISTGGGASLEYLEGKSLPGLIALT